jgi:hypothetical protein
MLYKLAQVKVAIFVSDKFDYAFFVANDANFVASEATATKYQPIDAADADSRVRPVSG